MRMLRQIFGRLGGDEAQTLYQAAVARARRPHWYLDGAVADTVDGRFDMIAAVLAMLLLRLEQDAEAASLSAGIAECFIHDMDGQLRQGGIGDIMVGKHIGKMMGMLGGRLAAYREALAAGDLAPALARNLYRANPPSPEAVAHVGRELIALRDSLAAAPVAGLGAVLAG